MLNKNTILFFLITQLVFINNIQAQPLGELIPGLLESHDKIKAAQDEIASKEYGLKSSGAAWLPTLDLKMEHGHEIKRKVASQTEASEARQRTVTLKQLIYDFGKTSSDIRKSEFDLETKKLDLESAKQTVLLDGVKAYVNLLSAMEELRDAEYSEGNIKQQTGMEQARVQVGSGFSTDVLKAKGKLAGASSTTITKRGKLVNAQNKFRSVFGDVELDLEKLVKPLTPYGYMPKTLDEAIQIAKENNFTLLKAKITTDKAIQTIKGKKATLWGPTIDLKVEYKHKYDWGGVAGKEEETLSEIIVEFPLYAGGKHKADLGEAEHDRAAAHSKYLDSLRTVEEKVRNAWQKVLTSQATAGFKRNQANIDTEFLILARQERQLGKRSLQDILSAENDYITSLGAAVKAETDMQLAAYELLEAMGVLYAAIQAQTQAAADAAAAQAVAEEKAAEEAEAAAAAAAAEAAAAASAAAEAAAAKADAEFEAEYEAQQARIADAKFEAEYEAQQARIADAKFEAEYEAQQAALRLAKFLADLEAERAAAAKSTAIYQARLQQEQIIKDNQAKRAAKLAEEAEKQ